MGDVTSLFYSLRKSVDSKHSELLGKRGECSVARMYPDVRRFLDRLERLQKSIGSVESMDYDHPSHMNKVNLYHAVSQNKYYWYNELAREGFVDEGCELVHH